jgi:hypothetical protein
MLQTRCARCHGPQKEKARLNLSSFDDLARGSRSGAVVRPGKPEESLLWQVVRDGKMPPNQPLPDEERALLKRWINSQTPGLKSLPPLRHWAYTRLVRPAVPSVAHGELVRTDLDRFVEAKLESSRLTLGNAAERAVLLRRVSFDLTGLPPTLAEQDAFLGDTAPNAYERMVERYLASPRYGERWAKYWLEAAGYADSNGYFSADSDRPLAYHYRDYVIAALNTDKPYDVFVREQLAGDELAGYNPNGDLTRPAVELLTATHFLRNAPDGTGESDGNPDEVRTDCFSVLEGNLQVAMSCLLGVTIQCARCHDHKFEPISQEEYYRLQAILFPVYCPDRWKKPNERVVTVGTRRQREEWQRQQRQITEEIQGYNSGLVAITKHFREQLLEERLEALGRERRAALQRAMATAADKRTPEQKELVQRREQAADISDQDLLKRFPEFAAVRDSIQQANVAREQARPKSLERRAVVVETDLQPPVHHVLRRGQHNAPGPEVQPGVPVALCLGANAYRPERPPGPTASTGRRTEFARWVTAPDNPLFARVMVNRVWQHHFGIGLVSSSANLGQSGARPSHSELLDYLAAEFVHSGYRVKALHRLIVCSGVYRQSSSLRPEAERTDPENRLLWRFPYRRLDAEAIRDSMLAVSGEIDLRMFGSYVPTERLPEGNVEVDENRPDARRRSIYLQQRRTQTATLLEMFDAPSIVSNCTHRNTSTVPLQSLTLLNSRFSLARARAFAERLEREAGTEPEGRVDLAFRLACGRHPTVQETAAAGHFLEEQQQLYAPVPDAASRAWADFCQMLLASNAFLYVD